MKRGLSSGKSGPAFEVRERPAASAPRWSWPTRTGWVAIGLVVAGALCAALLLAQ